MMWSNLHTLLRIVVVSLCLVSSASTATPPKKLRSEGTAFDFKGYSGSNYDAIQYLPQCGTLGGGMHSEPKVIGDNKCGAAINAFKDATELAAFYDLSGKMQPQLVNGTESCLCMGLQEIRGSGQFPDRSAICLWVNAAGEVESVQLPGANGQPTMEEGYISNYLPNLKRSLLLCIDVDMVKVRADAANSTTPPPPLRATNKLAPCVNCMSNSVLGVAGVFADFK
jgi:hypothetical protein